MRLADYLTMTNLVCGVLAILLGDLLTGTILVLLGAFFDFLDGRVARRQGPTSMGGELDSLADMVTFGLAPAVLLFSTIGFWVVTIPLAAAYRLARFNTQPKKKEFVGLPTPAAAIILLLSAWLPVPEIILGGLVIIIAVLMVSTIKVKKP